MRPIASISLLVLLAAVAAFGLRGDADATVPKKFHYQATVTAPGGQLIEGNVSLGLTLYDAETAGSDLWSANPILEVRDGQLDLVLPVVAPAFTDPEWSALVQAPELWLEVQVFEVDGNPVNLTFPRQQILTSGYALRAATVDGATGGTIDGSITVLGDVQLPDGIALTATEGKLIIESAGSSITLAPDGTVSISSSRVELVSQGDLALEAAGDVSIRGTNVDVSATGTTTVEGASGLDLTTTSTLNAVGSLINLN